MAEAQSNSDFVIKDLSAKIGEVDEVGNVRIEFSNEMNINDALLSMDSNGIDYEHRIL